MLPLFADAPEPTAPASTPLRIVPRMTTVSARSDADFPPNWRQDSREWAEARQFTRADVNAIEADRARFRAIRDASKAKNEARDAAFEAHWKEHGAALSKIPVPPVPHAHATIEEKVSRTERCYWYFDADRQPFTNPRALELETWFQTVSSPSGLHALNPVYHGWWRSEWLVVMAPDIRGQMCRQYRDMGGPYPLSEIEVAYWREQARITDSSIQEKAA
jgi:hypothetical protein